MSWQQHLHVNSVYVAVRVLVLRGGSSLQQASLWPRRVYRLWSKGLRREDYPERESSSLGFRRAQMAHSEARGLQQELVRRITGMWARCWGRLGRRGPWLLTLNPNGGNLTAPQGNGLQMHPFPHSCWCASISPIWCMNEAEQERQCDEKVGGGERMMWWRRGRQSLCVLWSLSYGFSLSGPSPGTLGESGSGRHPHSHNPRLSPSIQPSKVSAYRKQLPTSPVTFRLCCMQRQWHVNKTGQHGDTRGRVRLKKKKKRLFYFWGQREPPTSARHRCKRKYQHATEWRDCPCAEVCTIPETL